MPTSGAFNASGAPRLRAPPNPCTLTALPAPTGAVAANCNPSAQNRPSPVRIARRLRMSTLRCTALVSGASVRCGFGSVGEHGVRQAQVVVLREHDLRAFATSRAGGIAPHLVVAERFLERIGREQPAAERFSDVEQQLDGLERLD